MKINLKTYIWKKIVDICPSKPKAEKILNKVLQVNDIRKSNIQIEWKYQKL